MEPGIGEAVGKAWGCIKARPPERATGGTATLLFSRCPQREAVSRARCRQLFTNNFHAGAGAAIRPPDGGFLTAQLSGEAGAAGVIAQCETARPAIGVVD